MGIKIKITKDNNMHSNNVFMRKLLLLAPFIHILIWLNSLEAFVFWGLDDSYYDFFILLAFSFGVYYLVKLFFIIAKKWQKWVMYIYIAFFVVQTGIGFIYKYYHPPVEKFTKQDISSVEDYIVKGEKLPDHLEILNWNDSIGIIGKKSIDGIWRYYSNTNINSIVENKNNSYSKGHLVPDDFFMYLKLAEKEKTNLQINNYFWMLQYPDHYIYICFNNCNCGDEKVLVPCYKYFDEFFTPGLKHFKPILRELFEGKLIDRYHNFYKFFHLLKHPAYVRNDLAKDPYFLIYQGKYKEAREGLNDLPPERRSFCEKKLEKLGY